MHFNLVFKTLDCQHTYSTHISHEMKEKVIRRQGSARVLDTLGKLTLLFSGLTETHPLSWTT